MNTAIAELGAAQWQRLNQLLETALEHDEPERATWLAGLTGEAPELLAVLQQLTGGAGAWLPG